MNYYSVNDYCREHFGKKLYKIALDGGFTCPNRDGTLGTRGCIFCSKAGSGDFTYHGCDIDTQIALAKQKIGNKNKNGGWIAYFQSFTNTYAPAQKLKALYEPIINREDIDVLSIATRPDCLPQETLALLSRLNRIKPVWVELGLQTVKPESIAFIRRGYENEVFARAVKDLKAQGIYVIAHMILGLPGETEQDMINTLQFILDNGVDGVKLQLLHVLDDADLYQNYLNSEFEVLTEERYLSLLSLLIPMLPPGVAVHRLTGDGDKKHLVAPLWSMNKKEVINRIGALP